MSGSFSEITEEDALDPEGAFLVILTGLGPIRKDPPAKPREKWREWRGSNP